MLKYKNAEICGFCALSTVANQQMHEDYVWKFQFYFIYNFQDVYKAMVKLFTIEIFIE